MPKPTPPMTNVALTLLRSARGWTQKELAQATGIPNGILSDYEKGRRSLSSERLEFLAAALGLGAEAVEMSFLFLGFVHSSETRGDSPVPLEEKERRAIQRAAAVIARRTTETVREELTRSRQAAKIERARREAGELWERLKRYTLRERRILVESAREFQSWALCERLCAESERAAAADAGRALDLADLALRVATRIPGEEGWRSRVQGYAWAFVGNARRVANDLPGAEEAFARVWKLLKDTGAPDALDEGRIFDLAASLRRDQRRLSEAVELHEQALARTGPANAGYIYLNLAFTLEQMGAYERAIQTMKQAAPLVDGQREPRLLFVLKFNLSVNLCHLGRHREAAARIAEVREAAVRLGNGIDLVRVLWLEGRTHAGLERREEAVQALEQVRAEFAFRGMSYDVALVSHELAVLYLEERKPDKVKALARQMASIFRAQGVHREALAALKLFCEAVEHEIATVEMARRLVSYLERARYDEQLRFEGWEA